MGVCESHIVPLAQKQASHSRHLSAQGNRGKAEKFKENCGLKPLGLASKRFLRTMLACKSRLRGKSALSHTEAQVREAGNPIRYTRRYSSGGCQRIASRTVLVQSSLLIEKVFWGDYFGESSSQIPT